MSKAKCFRCGGTATADSFEEARKQINHAVGLSRGINCGDSYGKVQEIISKSNKKISVTIPNNIKTEPLPETSKELEETINQTKEKPKKQKSMKTKLEKNSE